MGELEEDIQARLQRINAIIFRSYFEKRLDGEFLGQVGEILQQNFSEDNRRSLEGSIYNRDGLELKAVKSYLIGHAEVILKRFEKGSNQGLETLVNLADRVYHSETDEEFKDLLANIRDTFDAVSKGRGLPSEGRRDMAELYGRYVLESVFIYDIKDFNITEDFLGFFFVCEYGATEKHVEITKRTKECCLVIEAKPDYETSGIRIYLTSPEGIEKLYEGPLK